MRLGESLDQDMIAVPISPPLRMVVAASPLYWQRHPKPLTPHDLVEHNCINIRLPTHQKLYAWEFEKDGKPLNVTVRGQLTITSGQAQIDAALSGVGVMFSPDDKIKKYLDPGELVLALDDWCPPFDGYYLYYPNRQLSSPALKLLIETLRYQR